MTFTCNLSHLTLSVQATVQLQCSYMNKNSTISEIYDSEVLCQDYMIATAVIPYGHKKCEANQK